MDGIPPTCPALKQHILRAVYQGALTWGQSLVKKADIQSPGIWGWGKEGKTWKPLTGKFSVWSISKVFLYKKKKKKIFRIFTSI